MSEPNTLGESAAYIQLTPADDAISSTELAATFLTNARTDERYWKWGIIALHSALQGALVLALEDGDGLEVQKDGVRRRMLQAFDGLGEHPELHMAVFAQLYSKAQNPNHLRSGSTPLPVHADTDAAADRLDTLRDEFVHFNVKHWMLSKDLLLETARNCLPALEHLLGPTSPAVWVDEAQEQRARLALSQLHAALNHV